MCDALSDLFVFITGGRHALGYYKDCGQLQRDLFIIRIENCFWFLVTRLETNPIVVAVVLVVNLCV